jgi:serine/threonine-protein kinase HipA
MSGCPITLEPFEPEDGEVYSREGLRHLHPNLETLSPLTFTVEEQIQEAAARAGKMSIQGAQPKLSALLKPGANGFEVVDRGGRFILKPCPPEWREVPANEALTMTLASASGIETPDHGLVAAIDGTWTYWVRRFDREGKNHRIPLEDFAQLQELTRDTKYDSSMERVVATVDRHCTFPAVERQKLARRVLFSFLTGNEDMHLKNFSLIRRKGNIELSPAYDLLSTTLVIRDARNEMALPIRGKMSRLTRDDLVGYFCGERCRIPESILDKTLAELELALHAWPAVIRRSFLSKPVRERYLTLAAERAARLFG